VRGRDSRLLREVLSGFYTPSRKIDSTRRSSRTPVSIRAEVHAARSGPPGSFRLLYGGHPFTPSAAPDHPSSTR